MCLPAQGPRVGRTSGMPSVTDTACRMMALALTRQRRGVLSVLTRVIALVCAIACAALAVYCVVLVDAAATFEHDSLPGPTVLAMVAVGVGLLAVLCGGVSHVLWRVSKRQKESARLNEGLAMRRQR
jgi:hypothetical protein